MKKKQVQKQRGQGGTGQLNVGWKKMRDGRGGGVSLHEGQSLPQVKLWGWKWQAAKSSQIIPLTDPEVSSVKHT